MKTFLLFLILVISSTPSFAIDCAPSATSCDLYLCQESRKHCGYRGYLIRYAYRYCLEIQKSEQDPKYKYSQDGRQWLAKTRLCLQQKLIESNSQRSCRAIKKASIGQHIECYVDSGYCQLAAKDKKYLMKALRSSIMQLEYSIPTYLQLTARCRGQD